MLSSEYELLYRIETEGVAGLDGIAKAQQQINLETKYSQQTLRQFEEILRGSISTGKSYAAALKEISASAGQWASVSRDVLSNETAMRRSMEESERAATKLADTERRAALQRQAAAKLVEDAIRRTELANQRAAERQIAQTERAVKQEIGGAARGLGVPGALALTSGSGAIMGGMAAGLALRGVYDTVKDAAQGARDLQNLADEFGITANQAFQFQAAARLAGVEIGTMSQAARRLSLAIEEPGAAGKQTAEAMTKLGVSLNQGPGAALVDVIHKLNDMHDAATRNALAAEILGRSFIPVLNAGRELDSTGVSMDKNITQKLIEANRVLADFDNHWTVFKASATSGLVIPIALRLKGFAEAVTGESLAQSAWGLASSTVGKWAGSIRGALESGGGVGMPSSGALAPHTLPLNFSRLDTSLAGGSKTSLDEQIEAAKSAYETERVRAENLKASAGPGQQTQLDTEAAKVIKLRSEYERLEASKKAAGQASTRSAEYPDALVRIREMAGTEDLSRIGAAMRERNEALRKFAGVPGSTNDINAVYATALGFGPSGTLMPGRGIDIQQKAATGAAEEAKRNQKILDEAGYSLPTWMIGQPLVQPKPYGETPQGKLYEENRQREMREAERQAAEDKRQAEIRRQNVELDLQFQTSGVQRQASFTRAMRPSGSGSPAADYQDAIDLANQEYAIRQKGIANEENADKQALDSKRALYEYMAQQDEAHIARMEQAKAIDDQQKKEAAGFFTGWFDAAISHRPSAVTNYLSGVGRKMVDQIIGNVSENTVGSLQNIVGLGRTGILGTPTNRSFLGKALKGTLVDFTGSQMAGVVPSGSGASQPISTANFPLPSSGMGLPSDLSMVSPSGFPVLGDIASSFPSGATMPDLGSGSTGGLDLDSFLGGGLPSAPVFGGSGSSSGNFALSPSAPSGWFGGSNGMPGAFPATPNISGANPSTMNVPYASNSDLNAAINRTAASMGIPAPTNRTGDVTGASKAASNLSKLFPGGSLGGQDLNAVLFGGTQIPGGGWQSVTGMQQIGAGIGLAGQLTAGTMQAVSGFGKGTAKGDISGVAGLLTDAASVIPSPLQPFAMAGATIMDLVSSLFPDPRQERIKQEQETLLQQAFIQPARHDYSFASSGGMGAGGGFAMSEGGAASGGGTVTNNHYWDVSAMDAKSFVQFMQDNPTAAESVVSTGITSGSQAALGSALTYIAQNGGW